MNYLIGIVVIALAIAYVILRKRKSDSNVRPDESQEPASKPDSTFHAVSLKFSTSACQAAKDMGGRRFLSGVAPRIPLPDCDANECRCKCLYTTAISVPVKVAAAHFTTERKVAPQRNSAPPANDEKIPLTILFRAKKSRDPVAAFS